MVRITTRWQSLGPGPHPSGYEDPYFQVIVYDWGNLPIVDVELTKWEWDGHEARFSQVRTWEAGKATQLSAPERVEVVMPGGVGPRGQGYWEIVPTDDATKTAMAEPTITTETNRSATIEFTDAGEKRWRRSNKGLLERLR